MNSLMKHFEELLKDKKIWQYYDDMNISDDIGSIFDDPKDFIKEYLDIGDKLTLELKDIMIELSQVNPGRLKHTVAIYFLGILLYSKCISIRKHIDLYIKKKEEEVHSTNISFNYYWFLICFIHDIGYSFKHQNPVASFEIFGTTGSASIEKEVVRILEKMEGCDIIPRGVVSSWNNYLNYRKSDENNGERIDHGILAGAYFYYALKELYLQKKVNNENKEEFIDNNLFWSVKMLKNVHMPIAWIIVAHNMWYCNKNCATKKDIKKYEDAGLNDLIIDKPIVNLKKYPLYFLLCLVDSIDPVKFLNNKGENDIESILSNTELEINNNEVKLNFLGDFEKYNPCCQQNLASLSSWMDLKFAGSLEMQSNFENLSEELVECNDKCQRMRGE